MHNPVRAKLAAGAVSLGTWNSIGHTIVVEILGRAGFEWVVMDLEHGVMDFPQLVAHCQVLEGLGVVPMCRLPAIRPEYFKWALDAGVGGVIVPWVRSAADARAAVQYAKYPPQGMRGTALTRAQGFGETFDDYVGTANAETMVILMIEHIDAVQAIDAILEVPGVDAVFIGPYDLSASMGCMGDLHHPALEAAVQAVLRAAQAKGIAAGLHVVKPAPGEWQQRAAEGFQLIALGMDVTLLTDAARGLLK
ncbi:MAG: 2,4-dihydroxyhept-2-ene-1,7-dioic acid aldolase [Anaerolineae bacterium]|nr:2,4-dihydroxyhept-2-ene-1,7-dioic acid aldolase [Anaerolineae bacterium]